MKPPRIRTPQFLLLKPFPQCTTPPRLLSRRLSTTPLLRARLRPTMRRPPSASEATKPSTEPSPESLYADSMEMPTINFYEAESTTAKPRLTDRVTTWAELAAKRKALAAQEAEMEKTLEEYEHDAEDASMLAPGAMVPLRTRILAAEKDEVHKRAMEALQVPVVDPKVANLNAMLKVAYVGANACVGRELWRSYQSAKRVERVLEGIPDGAWDLIWYSQAAVRKGRGGGEARLQVLREDLKSIGRNGPPTPEKAVAGLRKEMEEEDMEEDEEDVDDSEVWEGTAGEGGPEDKQLERFDEGKLRKAISDLRRRLKLRDQGHDGPI